ncbi:uncharacterized protein LOC110696366 [Chenopodium quinoa]|uniref:uncharacterized protein LOC110696366 n=1 Tax=Chenopodium quinoa TaxID=63459 RepID=UPI000B792AE8|nr:uncharacterized protein LOC110696366 [Chenopodium quinoa]
MKFGSSWLWVCNYDHSPKGRIWLGWNADRVTVNVLKIHEQFIHCSVLSKDISTKFHLTFIYGLHSIHDRLPMWEGIRNISIQHSPWLCAGDFNSVLNTSDRLHDLTQVKTKGAIYSWSNKAHTGPRTLSRIDRVFGNQAWLASHGHVETVYLPPSLSDHSLILLDICPAPAGKGRPLRFLNYIADHLDFLDTVSQAWCSGGSVLQKLNSIDQANVELAGIQNLMAQNRDDLDLYVKESDAIKPVSHAEIDAALKGIDNTKAPGIDGFNSFFFKRAWHIVKDDIYASVIDFFTKGTLWNYTTITLLPKIPNASHVITARLAAIIGEVIDDAQAGFIPGKHIGDNILLATELIKGYDNKFISPRCMVKVDLKKAYDLVEWGFLITVMQELAKKGLRQGDPMSPFLFAIGMEYLSRCLDEFRLTPDFNFNPRCEKLNLTHMMFADDLLMFSKADSVSVKLLFQAFLKFSGALELSANLDKSEVYFGGVSVDVQTELKELLGVSQGSIPFRYLGVPLSSKNLTIAQCRPLVEKVTARIQGWMAKHLSYAGRLQLVKSVMFGIQTYWAQIFILPKKIVKEIEKSLISWNYVCLPKLCGGWNLLSLPEWNKAAVIKLLWDIAHKADNRWKILSCRDIVNDQGGWDGFIQGNKMKIKKLYAAIRPQVWNKVLSILHVSKPFQQFDDEIEWLKKICRSSRMKNKVIQVAFTETVYGSCRFAVVLLWFQFAVVVLKSATAWVSVCCSLVCMELLFIYSCSVLADCSDAATVVLLVCLQICCSLGAIFGFLSWQLVFLSGIGSQNPS